MSFAYSFKYLSGSIYPRLPDLNVLVQTRETNQSNQHFENQSKCSALKKEQLSFLELNPHAALQAASLVDLLSLC